MSRGKKCTTGENAEEFCLISQYGTLRIARQSLHWYVALEIWKVEFFKSSIPPFVLRAEQRYKTLDLTRNPHTVITGAVMED